jgi:transposase InsO family protein
VAIANSRLIELVDGQVRFRWKDYRQELALTASGCNEVRVRHRPRLLSDNGPSYIAGELVQWLAKNTMEHIRGAPCHPQTQGKIERWHQTLKNRILLENYYLPGDLEGQIEAFVGHYNYRRCHESLTRISQTMSVHRGSESAKVLLRQRL